MQGYIENRLERAEGTVTFSLPLHTVIFTFGRRLTFYEKRRGRRFNEDRGKIRWRGFRDSQNPWCALSVHWTSRGVIVVIVYRPTYSSYEPIRVPLSFCLVRHSLKGSLGEDINLLTGRRVLTKFLAGTVLPSIT